MKGAAGQPVVENREWRMEGIVWFIDRSNEIYSPFSILYVLAGINFASTARSSGPKVRRRRRAAP